VSIIEEVASARDFGTLIPEIKGYSRDICPGIVINPRERIAILRNGEAIRVKDYGKGASLDQKLVFGLAWEITNGKNIDLDASAICLDSALNLVEIISFNHLRSNDGSIQHGGDEREGDEIGDDEKIFINLGRIQSNVQYVAFVINSYSGQELDDISKASCHLFNANTKMDLARYQISNDRSLDKHTGLLMACLYREPNDEWYLRIMGKAAQGLVAAKLVDNLQRYLRDVPPPQPAFVPEPEIIVNVMPDFLPVEDEIVVNPFIPQSNTPFVPGGSQPTTRVPFVPGGSQPTSNAPFVPGSQSANNVPFVPGSQPTSNAPFVPGSQPTSNAPFVPGTQPTSNAPFVPGSQPSSNVPFVPGSQSTNNVPFDPGSQPTSNAPFVPAPFIP